MRTILFHYLASAAGLHRYPLGRFGPLHVLIVLASFASAYFRHVWLYEHPAGHVLFGYALVLCFITYWFNVRVALIYVMGGTVVDAVASAVFPLVGPLVWTTRLWEIAIVWRAATLTIATGPYEEKQ